jgi:hypothetical protein
MPRKAKYDWGRSTNKRYQKFETRISTKLTATAASSPYADSGYIDIAQCLSYINRKLVRQGQVFKVKNMMLYSKDESPVTTWKVGALPRTWVMFNAYKKARSLWLAQAAETFAEVGEGNMPKYLDFKVLMDEGHYDNKAAGTDLLLPMDFDENLVGDHGDWDYSQFQTADATSDGYYLHMLGRHKDGSGWDDSLTNTASLVSAGMIMAYQQSRGISLLETDQTGLTQQDTEALRSGPFGSLVDTSDQRADLTTRHTSDNVSPPYDHDEYPGGPTELKEATTIATGRVAQKSQGSQGNRVPTFEAPLGLVRVEVDAGAALDAEEIEIHFDTEIIGPI